MSSLLGPYPGAVGQISSELVSHLEEFDLTHMARQVLGNIGVAGVAEMNDEDMEKALAFLSKTPSQRTKAISRLDGQTAVMLILRARFLGLRGARFLRLAENAEYFRGKSYRGATEDAARLAAEMDLYPTEDSMMSSSY